jgi:hypothetical protein
VFVFNLRYHSKLELLRGFGDAWRAIRFIARPLYILVFLGFTAPVFAYFFKQWRTVWIGGVWLSLGFLTVFWQGSFARSHYTLIIPPLVLLAAFALDGAFESAVTWSKSQGTRNRAFALAAAVVLAGLLLVLNVNKLHRGRLAKLRGLVDGKISLEQYYGSFWLKGGPRRGGYSFEDLRQIGLYLEERTEPDETVFVWGYRPIIAYLARRRMPTRFNFRYPLTRANNPRWWNEFLTDLQRAPPAYFVVVLRDVGLYHPEPSKEALEANEALRLLVEARYEHVKTVTDFEIYRLRPGSDPSFM